MVLIVWANHSKSKMFGFPNLKTLRLKTCPRRQEKTWLFSNEQIWWSKFTQSNILFPDCPFTCSVWSLGSSLHSKWYKCKTGPASRFLINGGSKSCTCLLQCFNCAACHIMSMCSLVILHSIARKPNIIWLCLITWKTHTHIHIYYSLMFCIQNSVNLVRNRVCLNSKEVMLRHPVP